MISVSEQNSSLILSLSGASENLGSLHPLLWEMAHRKGWFRLFVLSPDKKTHSLPEAVHLQENLARLDGSLAWVVTLCSGAGWFSGFVEQEVRDLFFSEENICIAGSGAASGMAVPFKGGYELNGSWHYATGALGATAFTANIRMGEENKVKAFVFSSKEVSLLPTWKSMGMVATGSHSFFIKNLRVPENRAFIIHPDHATHPDPVYRYPFLQLAETTLAANVSGMGFHFFEYCDQYFNSEDFRKKFEKKAISPALEILETTKKEYARNRALFYETLEASWEKIVSGTQIPETLLNRVSQHSLQLAWDTKKRVNELFVFGGLSFTRIDSEINRVWRDINTAGQHSLLAGL